MNSANIDISRHSCWKQTVLWLPQEIKKKKKKKVVVSDVSIHLENAHCGCDKDKFLVLRKALYFGAFVVSFQWS